MIVRRLVFGNQPGSTGGGGGPTPALVTWGPDFGNPPELQIGVNLDLEKVKIENSRTVGATLDLDSVRIENSKTVGTHLSGSVLGAPFFQGIGITTQTASSTSIIMTPDQTAANGDFLIVNIARSGIGAAVFTPPSGWTLIRDTFAGSPIGAQLVTYYKFAGVGEPATYTWTSDQSNPHIATIIRLTAVDTTTPINVEGASSGSAADPVSPSITTTAANCFMLSVCSQQNALTQTYTPPAGYVERADQTGTNLAVAFITGETATRVQSATGASGTKTHDSNQLVASNYVCHHIAIAPAELIIAS